MCEFCARELNPGLIDKMRSELPDYVVSNGDAKALLVAAVVGRNVQLQDERAFFRPTDEASSANAFGDEAFVFNAMAAANGNGAFSGLKNLASSNLMGQETSSVLLQTSETSDAVFWTYSTDASLEDWLF